jgi:hypothetical protein
MSASSGCPAATRPAGSAGKDPRTDRRLKSLIVARLERATVAA